MAIFDGEVPVLDAETAPHDEVIEELRARTLSLYKMVSEPDEYGDLTMNKL